MGCMHISLCLLLLFLYHLPAFCSFLSTSAQSSDTQPYGPSNLTIIGPDAVTVGVPCYFVCFAECEPQCNYTISVDGQGVEGKELAFSVNQWVSSENVTCTAQNNATGNFSTVQKTLSILEGPLNVSISPIPGENKRFLCSAICKPSCNYTWAIDGVPINGSGNEVIIKPLLQDTPGTLICKATNNVSGLFVTAILQLTERFPNGPLDGPWYLRIFGPDAITVGVPCFFVCFAECKGKCNYTISIKGQSVEGNELAFTVRQWVSSTTVTCTARNSATGHSATVKKIVRILEGPLNVSISGPHNLTPGESELFFCSAICKPSCVYTWVVNGVPINGPGDEVVFRPHLHATSGTLICKATNSVSGLFVTAVRQLRAPGNHGNSISERVELLPVLLFASMMPVFFVVQPL